MTHTSTTPYKLAAFLNGMARFMTYLIPVILFPLYLQDRKIHLDDFFLGLVNSAFYISACLGSIFYPTLPPPIKNNQMIVAAIFPSLCAALTLTID